VGLGGVGWGIGRGAFKLQYKLQFKCLCKLGGVGVGAWLIHLFRGGWALAPGTPDKICQALAPGFSRTPSTSNSMDVVLQMVWHLWRVATGQGARDASCSQPPYTPE
jgi:hypothetical protein